MKVRGRSGSLVVLGKEFARLGKYEFERQPGDPTIVVSAELQSIDRFLSRHAENTPVYVEMDFQNGRQRLVHNMTIGEKTVSLTAQWGENAEAQETGTHG